MLYQLSEMGYGLGYCIETNSAFSVSVLEMLWGGVWSRAMIKYLYDCKGIQKFVPRPIMDAVVVFEAS